MSSAPFDMIASHENALVKRIRLLLRDGGAYRKAGAYWLEGDHLCRAAHASGRRARVLVWSETGQARARERLSPEHRMALDALVGSAEQVVTISDKVLRALTSLESLPIVSGLFGEDDGTPAPIDPTAPTVVLDRLQDPGNVGSIVRSAAALGFKQLIAMKGSAAIWAPKVVRAGMGAHFALNIFEGCEIADLDSLAVPLLVTSSHKGEWLHLADLPWPCAWVMGHEGQGVSEGLMARASQSIRIVQPGGEESFNVAAAAAICLHASAAAATSKKAS